ncbi:hypothetical protein BDW_04930 [Bdellovibrio bacteriovorus W]|nr:hypothetical protein BDW_04930 [Bdellovibrio bacteriovorus W]
MSDSQKDLLPVELRQMLANKIQEKIPNLSCPMCRSQDFTLADGFTSTTVQKDPKKITLGSAIPAISLICKNCGFISQHALGVLKIMNIYEEYQNASKKTEDKENG